MHVSVSIIEGDMTVLIRDVNETHTTPDSKKFLGIENCTSRPREFQAAGPRVIFTI